MGLYDRDYTQADFKSQEGHFRYAPQMRMTFPKLTPVVKWLLIINIGVFLAAITIKPLGILIYEWFGLDARTLGLFFLGPPLEKHWGSRRFLPFYLGCGVAGALFYYFLVAVKFLPAGEM